MPTPTNTLLNTMSALHWAGLRTLFSGEPGLGAVQMSGGNISATSRHNCTVHGGPYGILQVAED